MKEWYLPTLSGSSQRDRRRGEGERLSRMKCATARAGVFFSFQFYLFCRNENDEKCKLQRSNHTVHTFCTFTTEWTWMDMDEWDDDADDRADSSAWLLFRLNFFSFGTHSAFHFGVCFSFFFAFFFATFRLRWCRCKHKIQEKNRGRESQWLAQSVCLCNLFKHFLFDLRCAVGGAVESTTIL